MTVVASHSSVSAVWSRTKLEWPAESLKEIENEQENSFTCRGIQEKWALWPRHPNIDLESNRWSTGSLSESPKEQSETIAKLIKSQFPRPCKYIDETEEKSLFDFCSMFMRNVECDPHPAIKIGTNSRVGLQIERVLQQLANGSTHKQNAFLCRTFWLVCPFHVFVEHKGE